MGTTGVDGAFKRCSEEVFRVLRGNASLLLTILEVIIHDPFYKWRLSPKQVKQKQAGAGSSKERNYCLLTDLGAEKGFDKDAAHRTIIRVKKKLQGYDESAGEGLSVEGQVEILINEARRPENLSRLFPGWAPWL